MNEEALGQVARRQWGVFSDVQARAEGGTRWSIQRRLDSGAWVAAEEKVYRFRGGHESWHQKVVAATLSLGRGAMASHRTAAFLWGLECLCVTPPVPIEVSAPFRSSRTLKFARVHHTRRPPQRPVWRGWIPTTPLARTLLDLAQVLDEEALFVAFDSARRKRKSVLPDLDAELATNREGRRGAECLAAMVERARVERATDSPLEARAAFAMDKFGIPRPSRQVVTRTPQGEFIAEVDFAWVAERVILQCDGHLFHLMPAAFEKDLRQRRQLESLGWRVIHVTWAMLTSQDWLRDLARLLQAQGATGPGLR